MYLLFPFYIKGFEVIMQAALYGGCFAVLCFSAPFLNRQLKENRLWKNLCVMALLIFLLADAVILITSLHFTNDLSYLGSIARELRNYIRIIAGLIIVNKIIGRRISDSIYTELYVNAMCIYIVATLILLIPDARLLWTNIVSVTEVNSDMAERLVYYTRYGLQGFSGYMHTCLCDIGILFLLCRSSIGKFDIIRIIILVIGCVCYGRVGILGALGLFFLYICIQIWRGKGGRIVKWGAIIAGVLCMSFILLFDVLIEEYWFRWAFEPFINFYETGTFGSSSSDRLQEMWAIPPLETFIAGDGMYTSPDGTYYMQTDVGFLRRVFFGGLCFALLCYSVDLCPLIAEWNYNKNNRMLILGSIMLILLFEYKGESSSYFTEAFFPFFFTTKKQRHRACGTL